eukprot:GHVU01160706.1.p2 GENE.GHVU01160706.1~~GHVU01160706.1.p2  ORF type:complete len:225 (-),score=58.20 GHVU01160706.1:932-1606(-)
MGNSPPKQTLDEKISDNRRTLNRSIRELDREIEKLQTNEGRLAESIRGYAEKGDKDMAKSLAGDLVRERRYKHKYTRLKSQLHGVNLKLQSVKSMQGLADTMKAVTEIMATVGDPKIAQETARVAANFERESMKLETTEEMIGDTIDGALAEPEDEEATDQVIDKVLKEIGVDFEAKISEAKAPVPGTVAPQATAVAEGASAVPAAAEADGEGLEARIRRLQEQ